MFNYKYLSKQHLKGFNKYKYSAIDTSPLSNYVMHPTWNTIVKFIPRSLAPNLITFLGFLCMVAVVIIMYVYDYDLYAAGGKPGAPQIPNWIFTTCGVLVFLAYNLDGIDGKQARRIGVSGPLGELFDHGLDSYIVFLIPFSILSIFGRDPEYSLPAFRAFLIVLSVVLNFYVSHFEKYNTGTLYLPWGYDLSMWVSSALFILAGSYGPQFFKIRLIGDMTFAQSFEIIAHSLGVVTTLPMVVYNIYLSYKNGTGQMHSFIEAIRPIWSLLTVTVAMVYWAQFSPNNIIEYDPRSFIFLYGTLFSNIASRLIIAEMSHQRCELLNWFSWPLLAGVVLSLNLPLLEVPVMYTLMIAALLSHVHYGVCVFLNWINLPLLEVPLMYTLMTAALLSHLHYGVCVVRQICDHLKINCFTVPKAKRK